LRRSEKIRHSRKLNVYHYEAIVDFKGVAAKLFFCRVGKRGVWHGLLTTNTKLTFEKAYELYATRWTIEVFFKECKQYLHLSKCEAHDFDAQIAATTLCMLQYNLFSAVKRFKNYESFGALFRQAKSEIIELHVKERIWLIIKGILTSLSDYFEVEYDFLLQHFIADNEKFTNIFNVKSIVAET
jgi:IS4 transposase